MGWRVWFFVRKFHAVTHSVTIPGEEGPRGGRQIDLTFEDNIEVVGDTRSRSRMRARYGL